MALAVPPSEDSLQARGRRRLALVSTIFGLLVLLLTTLHSPGQMSLDTVTALYEGVLNRAVGWGPPFMAALLEWLGGGVIGASVFVAANVLLVFGGFYLVITRGGDASHLARLPAWRLALATLIALNPLFLLYAGIIWKDVLLATLAMSAVVGLWALERQQSPGRWWLVLLVALPLAALPWTRQQALLIALPLWAVFSVLMARRLSATLPSRIGVIAATWLLLFLGYKAIGAAADATITPLPASPTGTGARLVMIYDVIGIVAHADAKHADALPVPGSGAKLVPLMRENYSAERIDTPWHVPPIKHHFTDLPTPELRAGWIELVREQPQAYLEHRWAALSALLGFGSMQGCVPGYWGVAGIPEHALHAGVIEEMDARDRMFGRSTVWLSETPVLRHWAYLLVLAAVSVSLAWRRGREGALTAGAAVVGAWLYFGSYVPTTIACDFRYLYPTAALACLVAIHRIAVAVPVPPKVAP